MSQGFEKTGLGERIANMFVAALGKSTLGLSYGLNVAEAILAPAMPSTSARAGGIFMPIIKSLSEASGSYPNDPSRYVCVCVCVCVCVLLSEPWKGLFMCGSVYGPRPHAPGPYCVRVPLSLTVWVRVVCGS